MDQPPSTTSRLRWIVLALVFAATTLNYVDRMVIGILEPTLRDQHHLFTEIDYGYINAAFGLCYAVGQVGAGAWLDRMGTRAGYAIALALWSIASMAHALVRGALGFGVVRALLGVAESPNFPAATKIIAEWFPRTQRALAMGIVNAGSNVGAVLAPWLVPWLALTYGWQWAFVATGGAGLLWLAFWIPLYRIPRAQASPAEQGPSPQRALPWRTLLTFPQAWAFCIGKLLTDPIWMFYLSKTASYFADRHGLHLNKLAPPMIAIYLMADAGSVGGGWISSALLARGWSLNAARKTALLLCAALVTPIALVGFVHNLWPTVALLGLAVAAHQGFSSNLYTLVSDTFPQDVVASVAGLGGFFGYAGVTIYSIIVGYALTWTHNNYQPLFLVAAAAYPLALLTIQFLMPRLTPAVGIPT